MKIHGRQLADARSHYKTHGGGSSGREIEMSTDKNEHGMCDAL